MDSHGVVVREFLVDALHFLGHVLHFVVFFTVFGLCEVNNGSVNVYDL